MESHCRQKIATFQRISDIFWKNLDLYPQVTKGDTPSAGTTATQLGGTL